MDFKDVQALMDLAQKSFKCLRSGECCRNYEVHGVPGYNTGGEWTGNLAERGRKLEQRFCQHLEPARIVEGQWHQAGCKLHDSPDYPEVCRQFALGFGKCPIGSAVWQARLERNPNIQLPQEVSGN